MQNDTYIKDLLSTSGKYVGLTTGYSMWPLLYNQRDTIVVIKNSERLKKYDVALYQRKNGKYILHRVTEVHDGYYITVGDHCTEKEKVTDDMVLGVLAGFYRKGKRYIDCIDGRGQKAYAKIWVALFPLRPLVLFAEKCVRSVRNKLLRR